MKHWEASVQYGDLIGTSAGDGHNNALYELDKYLTEKGVNTEVYKPLGIDFYAGERYLSFRIICQDLNAEDKKIVSVGFEKQQGINDLFVILKRLNVILLPRDFEPEDYNWTDFDDRIMIDDRD